jgi:hypothetical protein
MVAGGWDGGRIQEKCLQVLELSMKIRLNNLIKKMNSKSKK